MRKKHDVYILVVVIMTMNDLDEKINLPVDDTFQFIHIHTQIVTIYLCRYK